MTDQEKKGLFKNEVEIEKIDRPMFFKDFPWKEPISSMTIILEKLTDANIDFAIETDCSNKHQIVYIDSRNKLSADDALE